MENEWGEVWMGGVRPAQTGNALLCHLRLGGGCGAAGHTFAFRLPCCCSWSLNSVSRSIRPFMQEFPAVWRRGHIEAVHETGSCRQPAEPSGSRAEHAGRQPPVHPPRRRQPAAPPGADVRHCSLMRQANARCTGQRHGRRPLPATCSRCRCACLAAAARMLAACALSCLHFPQPPECL